MSVCDNYGNINSVHLMLTTAYILIALTLYSVQNDPSEK